MFLFSNCLVHVSSLPNKIECLEHTELDFLYKGEQGPRNEYVEGISQVHYYELSAILIGHAVVFRLFKFRNNRLSL